MKWETVRLDEAATIRKGKKHSETDINTGSRYLQIDDLHGNGNFKYTNEQGTFCTPNDVLIAWDGANAGKVGTGLTGMVGSTLAKITITNDQLSGRYLFWFLESKFEEIKSKRTGATIPHINGNELRSMGIPLPPLHIQEQIADTLDKADALRKKDQLLLQKYDKLAQAVFYDMFGDPVKNEKGWDKVKIRDIASDVKYGTSSPAEEGGKYPYLRMNNITYEGKLDLTDLKYITVPDKDYIKYGTTRGDLLFNRTNSKELVGKTTVVNIDYPMIIAGYIIRVRFTEKANPWYVSSFLNSRHGKSILKALCKSIIGMANINAQELQDIELILPPIKLQNAFFQRVQTIERQTLVLNEINQQTHNLFELVSSNYFS